MNKCLVVYLIISYVSAAMLVNRSSHRYEIHMKTPQVSCTRPISKPDSLPISEQTSAGPIYGTLVVAGGALVDNSTVFQTFLDLAGGVADAKILYFPTNGGRSYETPAERESALVSFEKNSGFTDLVHRVELIHTYSRDVANSPEFHAPIREATGVWFAGGLPYRSYDAYFGTETEVALDMFLQNDGVLGGSSAGALMQSNLMLRGDRNSGGNAKVLGDPFIGFGFGLMRNLAFDVHNIARNRAHDPIEIFDSYPEYLGIAVDEDTAFVLQGDEFTTVGSGLVEIFDPTLWQDFEEVPFCGDFRLQTGNGRLLIPNHGRSFFLEARKNNIYNVKTREVIRFTTTEENYLVEV